MTLLRKAASEIILIWGWKRALVAFAAGLLSALAMAPFNAWPILFLTFPVLVWLIDGAGAGKFNGVIAAAASGWWFGFGYFVAGLYWVGYAFLVDAQTFAWLLPVAVAGLPALLAIFFALGFALARALWTKDSSRILSLAVGLTVSEWLRGHILTGFPWNALGYALTEPLPLAQSASLVGLWGLTLIAVAIFASPATLIDDRALTRRPYLPLVLSLVLLAAMGVYGTLRLQGNPTKLVDNVRLRLMQPNLQQDVKFNYGARQEVMNKYIALSDRATGPQSTGVRDATILIWPESAFPFFLAREAGAMAQIADLLPNGTMLITGAIRPSDAPPDATISRAYNSIYAIDHDGTILSVYDKLHLVPFGEYLPFQSAMEKLGFVQLTKVVGGFIPGTLRKTMALPRAPRVLPLICYEAIFPGSIVSADGTSSSDDVRPGWIVNLTNDGWFGISTGPYQHLQQTRVRAIEEGLPIVRVANTGISAVIDPVGRILTKLALGVEGVIDSGLPATGEPTLYVRFRDISALVLTGLFLLFVLRRRMTKQNG